MMYYSIIFIYFFIIFRTITCCFIYLRFLKRIFLVKTKVAVDVIFYKNFYDTSFVEKMSKCFLNIICELLLYDNITSIIITHTKYLQTTKIKMGRVFLEHIGGIRIFSCNNCETALTNRAQLISTR